MLRESIIGVLLICVASGLRQCDDCTKIDQCKEAMNLVTTDRSAATINKLKTAKCGFMKICCSDFSFSARIAPASDDQGISEKDNEINNGDEIENHPNVHLLPEECGTIEGDRIIGGVRAKMNEFPWLALISHNINGKRQFNCGGTVINKRYILTAAHCIKGKTIVGVRVGEYDTNTKEDCTGHKSYRICQKYLQDVGVAEEIIHPEYVRIPIVLNDIGLLRLKKPLNLTVSNAGASCLPVLRSLRDKNLTGERAVVAGWGITENRTRSNVLLKVEVPIYAKDTCRNEYNRNKKSKLTKDRFGSAFCAGEFQHDSCGGDSGGPLMLEAPDKSETYRMVQFGIVSYGPSQCGSKIPGVYTEVKAFMKWILDTIRP